MEGQKGKITEEDIRKSILSIAAQRTPVQSQYGEVVEVDWPAKTCTVMVDDVEWFDVLLSLNSSDQNVSRPKKGTLCMIGTIHNKPGDGFLIWAAEWEEWMLNGDAHGGLVIAPELATQLNRMSERIDRLERSIQGGAPATGSPDSGTALIGSMKAVLSGTVLPKEDFSKIENEHIKHG